MKPTKVPTTKIELNLEWHNASSIKRHEMKKQWVRLDIIRAERSQQETVSTSDESEYGVTP